MKLTVTIKSGRKSYSEEIDVKELREYWDTLISNGHNPHLAGHTFEEFTRPIKIKDDVIDCHFIIGWMECLWQSDDCPLFLLNANDVTIIVERDDAKV